MKRLPMKERTRIPRQQGAERDPKERSRSFDEVELGLDTRLAQREAERCLGCAHAACIQGCPVGVNVREFVELVSAGDFLAAARKLREANVLPAITGRVCPQERQCEGRCVLGKRFEPLAIGQLERFVADYERRHGEPVQPVVVTPSGHAVAIVGSGPAGLSAAGDLVRRGHRVTVFEALHEPGGVLVYGIPEFRLPKAIVREAIDDLRRLGVRFETDVLIGRTITIDELLGEEGYSAVFIASGAGLPRFLGIPGEDLNGVFSANEFLTRVNLMRGHLFPHWDQPLYDCRGKDVGVVGGGNTALDAARTALRLGARHTHLIYRRSRAELPARDAELRHALEEGVELRELTSPVELLDDGTGWLAGARCERMELGPPDASGRSRPQAVPGSSFVLPLDALVVAIGNAPNPLVQAATPGLRTAPDGCIVAEPETQATSLPGVFAGGDVVTGTATVILAMGAGRRAAAAIDSYLSGRAAPVPSNPAVESSAGPDGPRPPAGLQRHPERGDATDV